MKAAWAALTPAAPLCHSAASQTARPQPAISRSPGLQPDAPPCRIRVGQRPVRGDAGPRSGNMVTEAGLKLLAPVTLGSRLCQRDESWIGAFSKPFMCEEGRLVRVWDCRVPTSVWLCKKANERSLLRTTSFQLPHGSEIRNPSLRI